MDRSHKPTYSRVILHGNAANKRGVAADFERSAKHRDNNARIRRSHKNAASTGCIPRSRKLGDTIVRAPPPKKEVHLSNDLRFTIPLSPRNNNIFHQMLVRNFFTWNDVMLELKTSQCVRSFSVDETHEIVLID